MSSDDVVRLLSWVSMYGTQAEAIKAMAAAATEIERLREQSRWDSFRMADKDCLIENLRARNTELVAALQGTMTAINVMIWPDHKAIKQLIEERRNAARDVLAKAEGRE